METRKKKSFKRLFAFLMAFVMVTTLAVSAVFAAPTFSDVPETHEFYEDIEFLYSKEIVGGYGSTGKYGPEDLLTRAQAAKMIALAAEKEVSDDFETEFTDVPATLDLHEHIWALEEAEVVKGFGDTNEFRPARNITRGHVAVMLQRALKLKKGAVPVLFTDLPKDDPEVKAAIEVLASNGVVKGYGTTGLFKPNEPVTRGQFARMVAGAMDATKTVIESVKAVEQTIVKGEASQLSFEVNGRLENATTFRAKYGYAALGVNSYEVSFMYDQSTGLGTATEIAEGKVTTSLPSFKFAVQVTDSEGEDLPETVLHTDYKAVTVVDESIPVKILEYGLYKVAVPKNIEADFIILSNNGDEYTIKATKALNGLGKEIDVDIFPTEAKSSKITVANWGTNVIDALAVGKTTFSLKFAAIKDTYSLAVEVKAVREVKGITNEDVRIAAGGKTANPKADIDSENYELIIDYVDQYGDDISVDDSAVDVDVQQLFGDREKVNPKADGKYDLSAKGNYKVTVRLNSNSKILGTFTIASVEVKETDVYSYVLEFEDPDLTALDINPLLEPLEDILYINVLAYRNGVEFEIDEVLEAGTSNDKIATVDYASAKIEVEAVKAGSITVTLYVKNGSMLTPKATLAVVVKNTAPQITDLKMKSTVTEVKATATGFVDPDGELESAILKAYDKDLDVSDILPSDPSAYVYSVADSKISVTLEAVYGGMSFEFPVDSD